MASINGYAVIVGVGPILDDPEEMNCTVRDAQGMDELLTDPDRCAFPPDNVECLVKRHAFRRNIMKKLNWLVDNADEHATVIIYFSCHGGVSDDGLLTFLAPYDFKVDNADTMITGKELRDIVDRIKAQKILLLLDCCHASGVRFSKSLTLKIGIDRSLCAPPPTTVTKDLNAAEIHELSQGKGCVFLFSSKATEKSLTGSKYSAFTDALLRGLDGDCDVFDKYIRIKSLVQFCVKEVVRKTSGQQTPEAYFQRFSDNQRIFDPHIERIEHNFPVAYFFRGSNAQPRTPFLKPDENMIQLLKPDEITSESPSRPSDERDIQSDGLNSPSPAPPILPQSNQTRYVHRPERNDPTTSTSPNLQTTTPQTSELSPTIDHPAAAWPRTSPSPTHAQPTTNTYAQPTTYGTQPTSYGTSPFSQHAQPQWYADQPSFFVNPTPSYSSGASYQTTSSPYNPPYVPPNNYTTTGPPTTLPFNSLPTQPNQPPPQPYTAYGGVQGAIHGGVHGSSFGNNFNVDNKRSYVKYQGADKRTINGISLDGNISDGTFNLNFGAP